MADQNGHVTWRETWAATTDTLGDRVTARWLCETASGCDAAEFDSELDAMVTARSGLHLDAMVRRVLDGEPVQYVMGRWAFRHLDLMVDPRVLIPRPETELIVEHVLAHLNGRPAPHRVVDLGTGSGAIGLSLLHELPPDAAEVWMTDLSHDALDVARANAAGVGRRASGARFVQGEWFAALPATLAGSFDAVVSNPPYIAEHDPEVHESVRAHEPHGALFSGSDGLGDLRAVVGGAALWLRPGGMLIVEMGHTQAEQVAALFAENGYVGVATRHDLAGRPRFTLGLAPD